MPSNNGIIHECSKEMRCDLHVTSHLTWKLVVDFALLECTLHGPSIDRLQGGVFYEWN